MKKYVIWKNQVVIGYIYLAEEQKNALNSIPNIGIYIGFDMVTNPEKYVD